MAFASHARLLAPPDLGFTTLANRVPTGSMRSGLEDGRRPVKAMAENFAGRGHEVQSDEAAPQTQPVDMVGGADAAPALARR